MQVAFGRVRRKTAPTGPGTTTIICSKIDSYGAVCNRTGLEKKIQKFRQPDNLFKTK